MDLFVGVTDGDWYELLADQPALDEVNFWQPGRRSHGPFVAGICVSVRSYVASSSKDTKPQPRR